MSRYSDDTLVLTLVRQSHAVLDELGLPRTFTIAEVHRSVERRRGRRIHLIAHPLPPDGPHGLWVMGETDDYVFYEQAAPPLRKLQIIGHEFGHIVFDDEGTPVGPQALAALSGLAPAADSALSGRGRTLSACTRTVYDDMVEQRCEWFGSVMVQRIDHSAPLLLPHR